MSSSEAVFTQVNGFLIITNNFVTMVANLYRYIYIYCFFKCVYNINNAKTILYTQHVHIKICFKFNYASQS